MNSEKIIFAAFRISKIGDGYGKGIIGRSQFK